MIASQLPEDTADALCVIDYVREILLNLGTVWNSPGESAVVLTLVRSGADNPELQ